MYQYFSVYIYKICHELTVEIKYFIKRVSKMLLTPSHAMTTFETSLLKTVWETSLLKTIWEKEKLLVTSNFSFSHSVFYPFE